jgi:hypothetical protein
LVRFLHGIPIFRIEEIEVSRAILGCDCFISWLYQGGSSLFRGADGNLDVPKVFDVMRTCVDYGVSGIDVSPPLIDAFKKLQAITDEKTVGLGAIQEWSCENFTLNGAPLQSYSEEIKVTVGSMLPKQYLDNLARFEGPETNFVRAFFIPQRPAKALTKAQVDSIRIEPRFFERRLELYGQINLKLVQFGGLTADWLVAIGRIDLLADLCELIRKRGFKPLLICHWASIVLPLVEKQFEVAGYIIPLNKLWSLLSLPMALDVIRNVEKPIIAMKPLARGILANDLNEAFSFLFKKAKVDAIMVSVCSQSEAKQTFSTIRSVLTD